MATDDSLSDRPIPVTVLSGSLGAGKTTLLNHVLKSDDDLNAAVVVNDMGEINIDAELVEQQSSLSQEDEEIIELSNGCICCRLRGDMLDAVGRLAEQRDFDYLLVESSGISEPIPVAQTFSNGFDHAEFDPSGVYELDTMVSVIDAYSLYESFQSGQALVDDAVEAGTDRVPEAVLMDQIEFCDVLILNKCDLVPEEALDEIETVLETLQPRAKIIRTEHGAVAPSEILNTGRFDFEAASNSAGWMAELQEGHHHGDAMDEHGVSSFSYRRDRPFHPERIETVLETLPNEIVRAKGFFWAAGREDVAMGLDKAGKSVRAGVTGRWIVTLPEEQQEQYFAARPGIKDDWDEQWGDRGIQLVFIGRQLDEDALIERLDTALLTDEEFDSGSWDEYADPFSPEDQRELALSDD